MATRPRLNIWSKAPAATPPVPPTAPETDTTQEATARPPGSPLGVLTRPPRQKTPQNLLRNTESAPPKRRRLDYRETPSYETPPLIVPVIAVETPTKTIAKVPFQERHAIISVNVTPEEKKAIAAYIEKNHPGMGFAEWGRRAFASAMQAGG